MTATESTAEILERIAWEREHEEARKPAARLVRIAITGGRDHHPSEAETEAFKRIFDRLAGSELHHGDSRGVDRFIAAMVKRLRPDIRIIAHPADWNAHGKKAGPLRNRAMVAQCDFLIAFPGGKGTQNCADAARELRKPVYLVAHGPNAQPLRSLWATTRPEHQHDPISWRWDPNRAAWIGRCCTCHSYYEASPAEAAQLEQDAAKHADRHPSVPEDWQLTSPPLGPMIILAAARSRG